MFREVGWTWEWWRKIPCSCGQFWDFRDLAIFGHWFLEVGFVGTSFWNYAERFMTFGEVL